MLHPTIKNVFHKGSMKKRRQMDPLKKTTSDIKSTKYIKYNTIKKEDLYEELPADESTSSDSIKTFHRKRLCWFVCGHWRKSNNKEGKIFVHGYWKGPLRELKMADPERHRDLDITGAKNNIK